MYILTNYRLNISTTLKIGRFCSKFSKSNLKSLLEAMPKETSHRTKVQKQRLKIKEKSQKYVPGKVILQVLGTGAEGAPKALYMFTDHSRYMFNCGEGTQRLAHEHKMKLSKLEHIFITQPVWSNIGGLPGLALTVQDSGVPQISLHGPEGLDELFLATRRFVILKDLTVKMVECIPNQNFEDNVMSVQYVPIVKTEINDECDKNDDLEELDNNDKSTQAGSEMVDASTSTRSERKRRRRSESLNRTECIDDDTDYYAHETSGNRITPAQIANEIAHLDRSQNTVMCYIIRLHSRPGALSVEKCVEAGVPPGPLLGKLKAGNDITLESGVVVRSKDVCLPDDPGPVIIVVDCPAAEYLENLVNNEEFPKFQSTATRDDDLAYFVVHFTPSHIMKDPRYLAWVENFSFSTQHLVLNDSNKCLGSMAVHRIQYKLNMLHDGLFPLLKDNGTEIVNLKNNLNVPSVSKKPKTEVNNKTDNCVTTHLIENLSVNSRSSSPDYNFIQPNTFCNIHLRPKKGIDRSDEIQIVPSEYIEETMLIENFPEELKILKEQLKNKKLESVRPYPSLLFLGTGSCIPNKTRNTSGILIQTSENSCFLMDCGEGTYGQIVRFFGYNKAKEILTNIKAVYISHLHADHHIGLIGLIKGRKRAAEKLGKQVNPLLLLAPKQILSWLNLYHHRFEKISNDYKLISNGNMILNDNKLDAEQKEKLNNLLGITDVNTVLVRHCPNAFGVAFIHNDGWKITYSGDTMPCEGLVQLGMDSDLLIHEATMEDDLAQEAIIKMHSTTSQAITVGQSMKAKHMILTHFSQRYAKLPRFNDNFSDNIGIAFDNMQVRLDEICLIPLLYPALRLMFVEHYEELEHKAVKRQLKVDRREASLNRKAL